MFGVKIICGPFGNNLNIACDSSFNKFQFSSGRKLSGIPSWFKKLFAVMRIAHPMPRSSVSG